MSNDTLPSKKPNLFKYGRKELSQDALICWLLDWANKEYEDVNPELHKTGQEFTRALFSKHGHSGPDEILNVEPIQQVSSIDVLVEVNDEYVILIEDKTETTQHGGQLSRYHSQVLEKSNKVVPNVNVTKDKFFPIFLKTGSMSKIAEKYVENLQLDPPYCVFNRQDFIKAISCFKGESEILNDFIYHLEYRETDFQSWKNTKPGDWSWEAWKGFYRKLECSLDKVYWWGYAPNKSGGFMGLAWSQYEAIEGVIVYLQIEEHPGKLDIVAFKIVVEEKSDRSQKRALWHNRILELAVEKGMKNVVKPKRFGTGRHMTVAVFGPEWRKVGSDGLLDYDATIGELKKLEDILKSAVEKYKSA